MDFLKSAQEAADKANAILVHHFGRLRKVAEKLHAGLVSEADQESEEAIRSLLLSRFPSHTFVGEESGVSGSENADYVWYVDPLDGTTNYVYGFPVFCTSIALEVKGELEVGVVYAPMLGLKYHAVRGGGAFLNGHPIQVSGRKKMSESLFATGFSYDGAGLQAQLKYVEHVVKNSRGLRRPGAAAMDLCWVAQGVFDLFWERELQPWDTAAGALLVQEAGGVVTHLDGSKYNPRQKHIAAGTPLVHSEFLGAVKDLTGTGQSN